MLPVWLQAGFWGLVGGSVLLGAAIGYFAIPQRAIKVDLWVYSHAHIPLQ